MTLSFAPLALLFATSAQAQEAPPESVPQPPPLSLEQATAMKCSAAFALAAAAQARGEGRGWPEIMPRGREFMVRASAQLMDETGRTRDQVAAEIVEQARGLAEPGALDAAVGPCALLLDASGL